MRLLIVNTPINIMDVLGKFSSTYDTLKMIPTGLAGLAAYVRQKGVTVRILDQYAESLPMEQIFALIEEFNPGLIGMGATTPNYDTCIIFARAIKARFPNILLVFGGYHPSILYAETLQEECVDFVIRDEGEEALLQLCNFLDGHGSPLESIFGLSFKTTDNKQVHNPCSTILDVDALPFPAYDLLPMHLYSSPSYTLFRKPVYQMIASRGCPYHCSFCINAELNVSAKYRRRSTSKVVDEMELLVNQYGARQIQFWDPIFPLGRKHAEAFCQEVMQRGLHHKIVWNSTTRPEFLTRDVVRQMVAAGCRGIGFGIESGVDALLESVNKKSDLEKIRQVCRICREEGLVVAAGFILGFPGETSEQTRQTIEYAKKLDIHYAQFSLMVPYPGTPMYTELNKKGKIRHLGNEEYRFYNQNAGNTELPPAYVPDGRTGDELKKWQRLAYREFYFRPILIWRHIPHLRFITLSTAFRSFISLLKSTLFSK